MESADTDKEVIIMEKDLWKQFEKSGRVNDYLAYKQADRKRSESGKDAHKN